MSKNKPAKKANDPMMARTDIPLALRKKLAQEARIRAEREDAASTVMKIGCVALNELYGIGFDRLTRFAVRTMELVKWFYDEDPDVALSQLHGRLEQMGFGVDDSDGRIYACLGDDGKPVRGVDVRDIGGK